jgi:predicted TIM-barrel fold metal-dependent hydrolase
MQADFASLFDLTPGAYAEARRNAELESRLSERFERLSNTVIGMAAGMAPIVHLTSGGVLQRHPALRFVVTEAECGWLAWTLQAMDHMQERRHLSLAPLPMKPSEYFRRQGALSFTDDPVGLRNVELTGSHCLLWSNDFPHDEGTFPVSGPVIERLAAQLAPEDAANIFYRNAARLYGFDVDYLAASRAELAAA